MRRWITINGSHVEIDGEGNIIKGNKELKGKNINQLGDLVSIIDDPEPKTKEYEKLLEEHGGSHFKAAEAFFKDYYRDKLVFCTHPDGTDYAQFTGGTWREIRRNLNSDATKAALIPHIVNIIKSGTVEKKQNFKERKDNASCFYEYRKKVKIKDKEYEAIVDVVRRNSAPSPTVYNMTRSETPNYNDRMKHEKRNATANTSGPFPSSTVASDSKYAVYDQIIQPFLEVVNIRYKKVTKDMDNLSFDAESKRRIDENGFMHVDSSNLTKEQVVPYYGNEIPGWRELGLDPQKVYYGYRPAEELEKAVETVNGIPLLLFHHVDSAENPQKEYRVGSLGTSAKWEAPYITNALSITDKVAIDAVESGRCREISLAYQYDPEFVSGEFEGKPYDFVMRNIRANHCALVEKGRAGSDVIVADSHPDFILKGKEMLKKLFGGVDNESPEIVKDEDKEAKIKKIMVELSEYVPADKVEALMDALTDLAYSEATGDEEPEAVEVEKEEVIEDTSAIEEALGVKDPSAEVKEAFAKGFEYGMKDGEEDMRDPAEREKLDEEHEREGMEKIAQDSAIKETKRAIKHIEDRFKAAKAVETVCVIDPMAFDSADGIYSHALNCLGIAPASYSASSAEDVYRVVMAQKRQMALDSFPKVSKFSGDFEGLNRIK